MPKLVNKFSLLNTDNDNDGDSDDDQPKQIKSQTKEPVKEPVKTIIQEEEEIAEALTKASQNKKNKKKELQTQDGWVKPTYTTDIKDQIEKSEQTEKKINIVRDDKLLENKELFDENKSYGDLGDDMKLNSYWTVWVHRTSCTDWKITGYQKIYVINSIGSFWRFFNNFQMLDTYHNNIFIMREEIAPIWEDVNNKFGGICSLKIDSIQRGLKTDLSVEIFTIISMLIMNETFIANNKNINGISFGIKKRSTLLKVWTKTYNEDNNFVKDLPVPLINKFNVEMQKQSKSVLNNDGKISIQYKQIKPEYEL